MLKYLIILILLALLCLLLWGWGGYSYTIYSSAQTGEEGIVLFLEQSAVSPAPEEGITLGIREITAYTPSPEETDDSPCITASGLDICQTRLSVVATNELPFGRKVEIAGQEYLVADRMSKKYPNRYDLLMYSKEEALNFGKQNLEVKLLK